MKDDLNQLEGLMNLLLVFKRIRKHGFSIKDCCEMFNKITFNDDPVNLKSFFNTRWSKNESLQSWNNYLKNPKKIFWKQK